MDSEFIEAQITLLQTQITAFQTVLTQLAANPNRAYSLNTGQTTESVTKADVGYIREVINGLIGDLQYWIDMRDGTTAAIGRPC